MDNYRRTGDDIAHRSATQRVSHRFWSNYEQPQWDSVAGNAYIEMMLVLPVLVAVFLGFATVASLFLGNMAVSQAAQNGVQALASGQSAAEVAQVVSETLQQEGYHGVPTTTTITSGNRQTVDVSLPYTLWNTGSSTSISAERTLTTLSNSNQKVSQSAGGGGGSGGTTVSPVSTGGGGGNGGTVYHHFPMGNGGGYTYHHFPTW